MRGKDKIGTEAEPRLTLVRKGPIWMKRSRGNGARARQSSGVAESDPSGQGPEQVHHSSKKHLVWWQLLGSDFPSFPIQLYGLTFLNMK